jgi:hypothetical protein
MGTRLASAILLLVFLLVGANSLLYSEELSEGPGSSYRSWLYTGGYGGYTVISGAYGSDGEVAQARFVMGFEDPRKNRFGLGAEIGIQSGNTMRLLANQGVIDSAGGLPIQTTLKPFIDLLGTFTCRFTDAFSFVLKGGCAYRQLQFEGRTSRRDSLQRINGEFQGGISYQLSRQVRIMTYYQRIFSGHTAEVQLEPNYDVTINCIPTQQGGFLGIEYSI